MSTVLDTISKKVEELALTLAQTTVAEGSACPCDVERDVGCPFPLGHPGGEHPTLAYVPAFPNCFPDIHH